MFISRIIFTIKDSERNTFEETASKVALLAKSLPGCNYFELSTLINEPTKYMLYEEWDSKQHADDFKALKERNEAVAYLAPTMAAAPVAVEYIAEPKQ